MDRSAQTGGARKQQVPLTPPCALCFMTAGAPPGSPVGLDRSKSDSIICPDSCSRISKMGVSLKGRRQIEKVTYSLVSSHGNRFPSDAGIPKLQSPRPRKIWHALPIDTFQVVSAMLGRTLRPCNTLFRQRNQPPPGDVLLFAAYPCRSRGIHLIGRNGIMSR